MSVWEARFSLPVSLCKAVAGSVVILCTYWPDAMAQQELWLLMLSVTAEVVQVIGQGQRAELSTKHIEVCVV